MIQDVALNDELAHTQRQSNERKIPFRTKCGIACAFVITFFFYRMLYKKYLGNACNVDKYHEFTYEANRKLYHGWDNTIIGIGQLLMDGWVIFMALYWFFNVKNMRFPSSIGIYFLFRGLLLNFEKFPFPEDIVWHNPGFFSFSVPYDHTRDFYYSGHTGTLTLISLQLWTLGRKTLCAVCLVSLVYMVNMLTITRIHYSIDILGALIFAPFWFQVISMNLKNFDFGFSFPFLIGKIIYKKCKKEQYDNTTSEAQIKTNAQTTVTKNPQQILNKELDMNDEFKHQPQIPYLNTITVTVQSK